MTTTIQKISIALFSIAVLVCAGTSEARETVQMEDSEIKGYGIILMYTNVCEDFSEAGKAEFEFDAEWKKGETRESISFHPKGLRGGSLMLDMGCKKTKKLMKEQKLYWRFFGGASRD